jgi:4-hydroxy-tetrahydrodipicolinate synthase
MFRGVYSVTVTPFTEAGVVDEAVLRRHTRWLLDGGCVHGIIPAGSTGEFAFRSAVERRRVIEIVIDETAGRVPVIAGSAACSTQETIEHTQAAQGPGAQAGIPRPPLLPLEGEDLANLGAILASIDAGSRIAENAGAK